MPIKGCKNSKKKIIITIIDSIKRSIKIFIIRYKCSNSGCEFIDGGINIPIKDFSQKIYQRFVCNIFLINSLYWLYKKCNNIKKSLIYI